ncbi:SbcC/MukB-like Walker B domain-containing protein [Deinococcus sp.]|uniref:SbcC/MukB-like Walker B domain-containing protein n=1 Tax=Deinococcus sp. TaxID=47478 RepID=UPI0025C6D79B|nr:SbcC/MukB-like Walker B domain-containing protein [Deinococcus sp.]
MTLFSVEDVQSVLARPISCLTPSRLILVNYWLYPIQIFHFVQGRLFLTGHNGSGKSTALTAAITMLLDGDSSPARLDPFGGTRRQLRYYLLGGPDAGFQERGRRSYLALEFRTPEGEYQTIGLGLSATEGSANIGKWGFWLDGRVMIGGGLDLVEDGQPLTERALREKVTRWEGTNGSSGGEFASGQGEYANVVRRRIYGASERDFQDTLDLLLTIRGSKLGREVRPAQIAELLRRSLPPVSAGVTAKLAEGIERLDRHAQRLQLLDTQTEAARSVAQANFTAALTRARFEAGRRAAAQGRFDAAQSELLATQSEETTLGQTLAGLQAQEQERSRVAQTLRVELDTVEAQIGGQENILGQKERELNNVRNTLEQNRARIRTEKAREERTGARRAEVYAAREADAQALNAAQNALNARNWWQDESSLEARAAALDRAEAALKVYERDTERLTERQTAAAHAGERAEAARLSLEEKTAALETVLTDTAAELLARAGALDVPEDALSAYRLTLETAVEPGEAWPALAELAALRLTELRGTQAEARDRVRDLQAEQADLQARTDALHAQAGAIPPLPAARALALAALARAGIAARPFYTLVKPRGSAPEMGAAELGGIEGGLLASGLLTALVVPEAQQAQALGILAKEGLSDALLVPAKKVKGNLAALLEPEDDAPAEVAALLAGISSDPASSSPASFNASHWQNGLLTGSATDQGVRYLGAAARETERQRQLALFAEGMEVVADSLDTAQGVLSGLNAQLAQLDSDVAFLRDAPELSRVRRAAARERDEARQTLSLRSEAHEAALDDLREAQTRAKGAADALATAFAPLDLPDAASRASLNAAHSDHRAAQSEWRQVGTLRERLARAAQDIETLTEQLAEHAQATADLEAERHTQEAARDALAAQLVRLRSELDAPDAAKLRARLNELRQSDRELERAGRELVRGLTAAQERLRFVTERLPSLLTVAADAQAALETAVSTLQAARAAHPRLSEEAAPDLSVSASESDVKAAEYALRDTFDRARPQLEAPESYHPHFAPAGPRFHLQGEQATPDALLAHLEVELDAARQLLTDEEAQVFHNELIRELVEELDSKQRQAQAWVKNIRRTLEDLHFHDERLDLQSRVQAAENSESGALSALIDARIDPAHQPESWWQAVRDEVRSIVHTLQARPNPEQSFAQSLERTLDYREWLHFTFLSVTPSGRREITDRTFAQRSGGERSAVLYTFLFAALAARFDQLGPRTPRLIGLDEAFAGMDLANIGALYRIMDELALSWIATSERRIDLSPQLSAAATYQLIRVATPQGSSVGSLAYVWDGKTAHEGRKFGMEE